MPVTVMEASELLGIDKKMAYHLADKGILPSKRKNRGGFRYITRPQLKTFVQTKLCWLIIDIANIPDPELRMLAIAAREATPGRWIDVKMMARHYGLCKGAIWQWRRNGWLKGQWTSYGRCKYLWATDYPEPFVARSITRKRFVNKAREFRQKAAAA